MKDQATPAPLTAIDAALVAEDNAALRRIIGSIGRRIRIWAYQPKELHALADFAAAVATAQDLTPILSGLDAQTRRIQEAAEAAIGRVVHAGEDVA